jgi:sulfide:quinone oxidoreductase
MFFRKVATSDSLLRAVLASAPVVAVGVVASSPTISSTSQMEARKQQDADGSKHRILIVGGGTAGIGIAAQLRNKGETDVAILEPSKFHYYQPLWTLVGGGLKKNSQSAKPMSEVIPHNVRHIQDAAETFDPDANMVRTKDGNNLKYDYLIVATGMQQHFDQIDGLKETIGENGVVSIYDYDQCQKAQEAIKNTKSGNLIFTQHADSPIKCGGAPQKIMWLAEDAARLGGFRQNVNIKWVIPQPTMFPVQKYGEILAKEAAARGIERHHGYRLCKIDGPNKLATFEDIINPERKTVMNFDILHVIPFMKPPSAVSNSKLADKSGFVDVDKNTLQHKKYPNVFAAGDSANLPTSKTMAAVAKQAPVLVNNLLKYDKHETLNAMYDGYTSCPITTKKNRLLLAEFKYGGELAETFPFLQNSPRRVFMFFKETLFPIAYFNFFLKGHWYGPNTIFPPRFSPAVKTESSASIASSPTTK